MSLLYSSPLKSGFPLSQVCGRLHLISHSQNWLTYRHVGTWPCGAGGVPRQPSPWLLAFPEQLYCGKSRHWATAMNGKTPRPMPISGGAQAVWRMDSSGLGSLVLWCPAAGETVGAHSLCMQGGLLFSFLGLLILECALAWRKLGSSFVRQLPTVFSSFVQQTVWSSPGVSKLQPADRASPMSVFLSDILLEHSHVFCFKYICSCLLLVAARATWPTKPEI